MVSNIFNIIHRSVIVDITRSTYSFPVTVEENSYYTYATVLDTATTTDVVVGGYWMANTIIKPVIFYITDSA